MTASLHSRGAPGRSPVRLLFVGLLALGSVGAGSGLAQTPPESASYVLQQDSVNSGGESAASPSYVLDGSVAQRGTVGETMSSAYIVESGFWTSLSTLRVLRVAGTGTGDGTVTGPGIQCQISAGVASGDCSESFVDGAQVELIADPDAGNQFDGWSACDATATTAVPGDTCLATIGDGRTVVAEFTLQATLAGRVWRDVDGDGVQDADEPGFLGVVVVLEGPDGLTREDTTTGDGEYSFVDLPPGDYTVSIVTASLPPGVVPTTDPDGVATPHEADLALASGENAIGAAFGYQPQTDLSISKVDDADPLPGGDSLTWTITVENVGPGIATDVQVTDVLPMGTTLIETVGCAEDPLGVPTCSLGDLEVGESASYTIEVSIDPGPPSSITNTASVSSTEVDLDAGNSSASQSTELDSTPPLVARVEAVPATDDSELTPCETVNGQPIDRLLVTFTEEMFDPAGDTEENDVTNPASWLLVRAGGDAELDTVSCGAPAGDDRSVPLERIAYDGAMDVATLDLFDALDPALYRLFACGGGTSSLVDLGGTALDGDTDGSAGGDFALQFRADPENEVANGHFDCDLDGYETVSDGAGEITHAPADADGSADSGSALVDSNGTGGSFALSQCLGLPSAGTDLRLSVRYRLDSDGEIGLVLACSVYEGVDCTGASGDPVSLLGLVGDTDGVWRDRSFAWIAPEGSSSAVCSVDWSDVGNQGAFEAWVDQLILRVDAGLFADDFESGDLGAWSEVVP